MLLVCGEALFDLFVSREDGPGALQMDARAGGSPFNVAVGVARLGGRVGLFTGLSRDLLGVRLEAMLHAEGVDTRYIVRSGRRTTLSVVGTDEEGQPAYAFYGVGSADCAIKVADLPVLDDEVRALHFGSFSIAVPPVADALAELSTRESSRFISLDPNVRPTIEPDMSVWRERIGALLSHADVVKVSVEDLAHLYPGDDPETIAREWLARGPRLVLLTDGGGAVRGHTARESVAVSVPAVEVVDTVGAGDTFQAALLEQLLRDGDPSRALDDAAGEALRELLDRAARAAAVTCTRRGADLPNWAEVPV